MLAAREGGEEAAAGTAWRVGAFAAIWDVLDGITRGIAGGAQPTNVNRHTDTQHQKWKTRTQR